MNSMLWTFLYRGMNMPKKGDVFLSYTYQRWGEYNPKRISQSRTPIPHEVYLAIPKPDAVNYNIYMSNVGGANTDYDAYDHNGDFICVLKAQGHSGDFTYAKQLSGRGNLKALADWIINNNITDADTIEIEFLSPTSLKLTKV